MAQLAIKGSATRGKEIIALLEMLGGYATIGNDGNNKHAYYLIDGVGKIYYTLFLENLNQYKVFTLEEFEEKFPYKVGDKVLYKTYGLFLKIKSMLWNKEKEQVIYRLDFSKLFVATVDELQPCKEV